MQKTKRKKWFMVLSSCLTGLCCFSVGFASWCFSGADSFFLSGDIRAEQFGYNYVPLDCIYDLTINPFSFGESYGFVVDGVFTKECDLSGTFSLNVINTKEAIDSILDQYHKFTLFIEFTTNVTTNFTYGDPYIGGLNNSPSTSGKSSNATTYKSYDISMSDDQYSSSNITGLTFGVHMQFTGTIFPDLSQANYSISIGLGEYNQ